MGEEYRLELAKKLMNLDDEEFKLVKEILVDSKVKFMRAPIRLSFETFNINIIKELNTAQLRFLLSLINAELEKREG